MGDESHSGGGARRLVWNPLHSEYTAQAPARMRRREGVDNCPFCADLVTDVSLTNARAWIRPNDFPALTPPDGECLLLIYSREHARRFAQLRGDETLEVIRLWQEVYDRLSPLYACVMTWETSGAEIGQTQSHPHGQAYGVSIVPELLQREMEAVHRNIEKGLGCLFCRSVREELAGSRIVYEGSSWVGFVPPWARYPYQVQLVARDHFNAVTGFSLDSEAARELSCVLPQLIRAWDRAIGAPMPYMLALHQLADPAFHFHIELLPVGRAPGKLKLAASSEMAWGFWLNDSLPEEKAAELRELLREE